MSFLNEYWQILIASIAALVWSIRLEGKVQSGEKREREDPVVRKELFELYTRTERENVALRLDILAREVSILRETVKDNHTETLGLMGRIRTLPMREKNN